MKRLICIFALAAAVACETEYPSLNGMGDSPIVHIQALPGLRDTMTLIVETAHPIGSSHKEDSPEEVRVKVDGKEVEVHKNDGSVRWLDAGGLYVTEPLPPGSKVEITARSSGTPVAEASTAVPGPFPAYSYKTEWTTVDPGSYKAYSDFNFIMNLKGADVVRLDLKFKDEGRTDDFYGVMLVPEEHVFRNEAPAGINIRESGYVLKGNSTLSVDKDRIQMICNPSKFFRDAWNVRPKNTFVIFSDEGFNGKEVVKEFLFDRLEDYIYAYDPATRYEYHYRLLLFRLSEELYRYAESCIISGMSDLLQFGQAPFFPYTNVTGGSGAFAALSMTDAGLLEIPEK